jgi:hypothetical protein
LSYGDEIVEEAFAGIGEAGIGEGVEGTAEANFVACHDLVELLLVFDVL